VEEEEEEEEEEEARQGWSPAPSSNPGRSNNQSKTGQELSAPQQPTGATYQSPSANTSTKSASLRRASFLRLEGRAAASLASKYRFCLAPFCRKSRRLPATTDELWQGGHFGPSWGVAFANTELIDRSTGEHSTTWEPRAAIAKLVTNSTGAQEYQGAAGNCANTQQTRSATYDAGRFGWLG
jgi:hypothetical protein